jgi:hypothetical protein
LSGFSFIYLVYKSVFSLLFFRFERTKWGRDDPDQRRWSVRRSSIDKTSRNGRSTGLEIAGRFLWHVGIADLVSCFFLSSSIDEYISCLNNNPIPRLSSIDSRNRIKEVQPPPKTSHSMLQHLVTSTHSRPYRRRPSVARLHLARAHPNEGIRAPPRL